MGSDGRDRDEDRENAAREAALYDPDTVFHDHTSHTTADRAVAAVSATHEEPSPEPEPEPDPAVNLYARKERKRAGALTPDMIKRIADRAERAARKKG